MPTATRPPRRPAAALTRLAFASLLALAACVDALGPEDVPEARRFAPPVLFQYLWDEVRLCSGRAGDFDRVRWYEVPGQSFQVDGVTRLGYWWPTGEIVLPSPDTPAYRLIVRHEMLHEILGTASHPAEYFRDRCGGYVY